MKNLFRNAAIILTGVMLLTAAPLQANAKPARWNKACKSYRTFLGKNVSHFSVDDGDWEKENKENYRKCAYYLICDMNTDGTPELVTLHPTGYRRDTLYVYRFNKGKVQKIKSINIDSNALGYYDVYKDKKGYLHTDWAGTMTYEGATDSVYSIRKGKVECYLYYNCDPMTGEKEYRSYNKSISGSTYNKLAKKLKKSGDLIKNNASGRKMCK